MNFEKPPAGVGAHGLIRNSPESARLHSIFSREIEENLEKYLTWLLFFRYYYF